MIRAAALEGEGKEVSRERARSIGPEVFEVRESRTGAKAGVRGLSKVKARAELSYSLRMMMTIQRAQGSTST